MVTHTPSLRRRRGGDVAARKSDAHGDGKGEESPQQLPKASRAAASARRLGSSRNGHSGGTALAAGASSASDATHSQSDSASTGDDEARAERRRLRNLAKAVPPEERDRLLQARKQQEEKMAREEQAIMVAFVLLFLLGLGVLAFALFQSEAGNGLLPSLGLNGGGGGGSGVGGASRAAAPASGGSGSRAAASRKQQRSGRKVRATEKRLKVDLAHMYTGAKLNVDLQRQEVCPVCHGDGAHPDSGSVTCPVCRGTGHQVFVANMGGFQQRVQQTCQKCGGTGKVVERHCPHCHGAKMVHVKHSHAVEIERGMRDGDTVVLDEEGDQHPDAWPGDLIFHLQEAPHAVFKRDGDDLTATINVPLSAALEGFERSLKHLDGRQVVVRSSGVTQPGAVIVLQGEGMPVRGSWSSFGDLRVTVNVKFPSKLSATAQKQLSELLPDDQVAGGRA